MEHEIHEECGVFGIFAPEAQKVASTAYYALFALQHRGQESAGIVVNNDGVFNAYKDVGLVNDIFTSDVLNKLGLGNMAIGHVRYGTTGTSGRENAQPIVVNHLKGNMALAHNGNLINATELRAELENEGCIFHTTSDTEVIAYVITRERVRSRSIEEAVLAAMNKLKGAYSLVVMSPSKLIAARDPHGFRPLCFGKRDDGSYLIASESCALNAVGAHKVREIEPGEMLVITKDGIKNDTSHCGGKKAFCVFEYFYTARPDSEIDGCYVHDARKRAGAFLAEKYKIDADIVVGVPDSGLDAALGYAQASGIPYGIGFLKNKYIGRTFIAPDQKMREDRVKIKLNVIASAVRGLSSAPKFLNPCYYGTDIDSRENLIACHHTTEEIAQIIGADSVGYLDIEHARLLAGGDGSGFCCACFDGVYPTEIPQSAGKDRFEQRPIVGRPISENPKFQNQTKKA